MRVYVDSSALLKRSVAEAESDSLEEALARHVDDGDPLVSSSLAWIEVSRALRRQLDGEDHGIVHEAIEDALSGIAERPVAADVVSLARRIGPNVLRSLDAIHLATAILVDADVVITYDERLAEAARHNDITVAAPSPNDQETLAPEGAGSTGEQGSGSSVQKERGGTVDRPGNRR